MIDDVDRIPRATHPLGEKIVRPGDGGFDAAAAIWNRTSARPAAVALCATVEDVQEALRLAREGSLPLSVRAGGHDWAGRAMCDGLVIDLTGMTSIGPVADERRVRIGGGVRAIDLARRLAPLDLAAVTGAVGVVGLGGLTLGGGYGPLIGAHGLASDNLLAAQVVLADGSVRQAGERPGEDADLLWALRGGGGNFGIVTELEIAVHPLGGITGGIILYSLAQAAAALAQLQAILATAPDELTCQVAFVSTPDGSIAQGVVPSWLGAKEDGATQVAPFMTMGEPLHADVRHRPVADMLSLFDGPMTERHHVVMDTRWVAEFSPAVIDVLVRTAASKPSPGCAIVTHEFRGAASRMPSGATAFGFRRPHILIEIIAQFDDDGEAERSWAAATSKALAPVALEGGYANLLPSDDRRADATFGPNAARLAALKRRYDPDGLFGSAIRLPGRA